MSASPLAGLPGEQALGETPEAAAARLADALVAHLRRRLSSFVPVHVALSGATSGKLVATALGLAELRTEEWARIHVWMVDERAVGPDDPALNFASLRQALLAHAPVPPANLHPMPVLAPDGAERYEAELRAALAPRPPDERRLDAIVLGLGADGHTASLFPASPALAAGARWIAWNDGATVTPPRPRLTMTFSLIGQTPFLALFVTGASKHAALARVAEGREDYRALPVAGVVGSPGARPLWFLDRAALRG